MHMFTVYVKTDSANRVVDINSDAFLLSTDGWTAIDKGTGDKFLHAQSHYLEKPLRTDAGICRYYLENGVIYERASYDISNEYHPVLSKNIAARISDIESSLSSYAEAYNEGVNMDV